MGYERYPRGTQPGDYYNRDQQDYGRDYGSGRFGSYSSARDYAAAGEIGGRGDRDDDRQRYGQDRGSFDQRSYGADRYGSQSYGSSDWNDRGSGQRDRGRDRDQGDRGQGGWGGANRYAERGDDRSTGSYRDEDRGGRGGDYGRQPQGYNYDDRGFMQRAGDEVRSWFGDEDAERRRNQDARYDERQQSQGYGRDEDYHNWRRGQMDQLDRDYHEYRQENSSKWASEFGTWRQNRQGQRDSLTKVKEHMEVLGSDKQHVGTVDHVRGDRILLTKNDKDAGGHHHSIPSSWIQSVDDKVTISKSADEAQRLWKDEEQNQAMFGQDRQGGDRDRDHNTNLNRSFSDTY